MCLVLEGFYGARNYIRSYYERQGVDVNREVPTGNQAHSAHLSSPTAQSLLRPSRHPRNSRPQESDKHPKEAEEKDDSKGEERKSSSSPYVVPTEYELTLISQPIYNSTLYRNQK